MRQFRWAVAIMVAATPASAFSKEAWEISPRWICTTFERIGCNREKGCESGSAQAVTEVDFTSMTIVNFTGGSSVMTMKSYYGPLRAGKPGRTYFANGSGQMFVLLDEPTRGLLDDRGGYPIQSVSLFGAEDAQLYYGECRPR